jgi:DNA-binding beta-propeller fold protein YncE
MKLVGMNICGLALVCVASVLSGCGGGGGYGGNDAPPAPPPPPPVTVGEATFSADKIQGLGFTGTGITTGKTDANGKFSFPSGQTVQFFLGTATKGIFVGTAKLTVPAAGSLSFTAHQLDQAQGANGNNGLSNFVALLQTLDADSDPANGIVIDDATNAAIADAVTGTQTLNLALDPQQFAADPIVAAVLTKVGRTLTDFRVALARFSENFAQSRSSSIAMTSDDTRIVVANRQKASVSVIRVRDANGADVNQLLAEVPVGKEPRFVAVSPDDKRAFVTNAVDGTMSVIDLTAATPVAVGNPVAVGLEPRGIAVSPNGTYAVIANNTVGTVTIVRLSTLEVVKTLATGGNPQSVAITNDGDSDDKDERVFVTRLFSEVIDPARADGFDDAKQGIVDVFNLGTAVDAAATVTQLKLLPLASGFTADRRKFCLNTRKALQPNPGPTDANNKVTFFNSGTDVAPKNGADALAQPTFCPDINSTDATDAGAIAKTPQKVYPNMLNAALVRGPFVYIPNVGASPEPPVLFNVNVQALVGVLDRTTDTESNRTVNLNSQVAKETQPADNTSLDRLFLNDIVAIDADKRGRDYLVVSRGGNVVIRASLDADGKLFIGAPGSIHRYQTGNMPTGVVMSRDGKRAYTDNEINTSVTAINLETNAVLAQDIESSAPPAPGSIEHRRLLGKLAFFTALGLPDKLDTNGDGSFDIPLRDIIPIQHRGKASNNAWSGCSSCHDDGHSDNVTWIFETGPRQTIPLEGTFAHNDLTDQRILNWSGVRGSNTDFNNNARDIQGGNGFATDVGGVNNTALVFNHGPTKGVSDSLDAMSEWVATVRAPIVPSLTAEEDQAGRALFVTNCASCHGGAKWTKSRTSGLYANNPTFLNNPIGVNFFKPELPIDPNLTAAGPQLVKVQRTVNAVTTTLALLDNVGTFSAANPIELRGAAAVAGQSTQGFVAFGAAGFNSPSLLGLSLSAPYFHDGSALTLQDVAQRHLLPAVAPAVPKSIAASLSAAELESLLKFIGSIDNDTPTVQSAADTFLGNP